MLNPGERLDDTGFGDIRVIQNKGFGYGVDSVLLAAFAAGETGAKPAPENALIADLGTGCGIIPFILSYKLPHTTLTGIDISESAIDRANRACRLNGLEDRISFINTDINNIRATKFDAVVTNPPYFVRDGRNAGRTDERYVSRHETTADIGVFARCAAELLNPGGSLYLVHRPDRLTDIFEAMRTSGIEPKEMQMAAPVRGEAANIVLIHGIKGAGSSLRILPEIQIRNSDGSYTGQLLSYYGRTQ